MKRNVGKKILAFVLSGALVLGVLHTPMSADAGETVLGKPETMETSRSALGRNTDFNEDWKFYLGASNTAQNKAFDDSSWGKVNLPHDFSISQNFTTGGEAESGFLPGGTGWYRKTFTLSSDYAAKTVMINFDGVYSDAYVYVNGEYVGENHYGYNSFAFDISKYVVCDDVTENVIAVKAVNNIPSSRWYSGSGIYRDVTISVMDKVHVDYNGTYVTTPNIESGTGTVNIAVDVVNDSDAAVEVVVTNTITKKGSEAVLATATNTINIAKGTTVTSTTATSTTTAVVASPQLWSIDNPNLYEVHTALSVDGKEVDKYDTTFGFRYASFDNTGFHLNGENIKLNGVCMHHDQGALGAAAYYDAIYRQMSIMKEMGCNAIRVTHNPASKALIEICDELGLLVIEELFDGLIDPKNGNSNDFSYYFSQNLSENNKIYAGVSSMTWAEFVTKEIVKRDRNAASIIAWSIGNEIQEGTVGGRWSQYPAIANNIIKWIRSVDTTRPATSGDNNRGIDTNLVSVINNITSSGGIAGFNYVNTAAELKSLTDSYAGTKGVIIASETSSAINSRGIYTSKASAANADGKYHLTSYDTSSVTWGITAHDSIWNTYQHDCVAGEFVWTGFDYIGEPTPWNRISTGSETGAGAIPNSSYFGIVETTGFEKDTYYLYRSQWNKKDTTLHLVTAWDSDNYMVSSDKKTPVWIYSNAPYVELYRDDTLIGTAERVERTSEAQHTYYTYNVQSVDSSICKAVSPATGADSLYAAFDVTYQDGTIHAKAYQDKTDKTTLIQDCVGKSSVSTPSDVKQLDVTSNVQSVKADGKSLIYVTVDVLDKNGNLDTTATNNIQFTLTGPGEILGVDNGDQATVKKYQQTSVLTSKTTANINAYAGKALAIIKTTKKAGEIAIDVTSNGLSGESIALVSTEANENKVEDQALASYTLVRDYSVKVGTSPKLETEATGILGNGTSITGQLTWDSITSDMYQTARDYEINGTLKFENMEAISVSCRLHVIHNIVAVRNISVATAPNTLPKLPDKVAGVLADANVVGEFSVTWGTMSEGQFANVGDIIEIQGVASVFGTETMPVKAFVRVAELINTNSSNVATSAKLEQDIPSGKQDGNLSSIINSVTSPAGDNGNDRWTNWAYRNTSNTAAITLSWATVQSISDINLFYRYDNTCAKPESVVFEYSNDGVTFTEIKATEEAINTYVNYGAAFTYALEQPINPIAIRIVLTQQNGKCVGLYEVETMTFTGAVNSYSSDDLSNIYVDNVAVSGFAPGTLNYDHGTGSKVTAEGEENVAITVLPAVGNVVRILTLSEDGTESKVYSVTISAKKAPAVKILAKTTPEGQITVKGLFDDYAHKDNYFGVTNRGLLFYETAKLGSQALTVNTEGRTKVNFTACYESQEGDTSGHESGSFWYHKTPESETMKYTVRAFLEYVDVSGKEKYVYSEPLIVAYDLQKETDIETLIRGYVDAGAEDSAILAELQSEFAVDAAEAEQMLDDYFNIGGRAYGICIKEAIAGIKTTNAEVTKEQLAEQYKEQLVNAMMDKFGPPDSPQENTYYITEAAAEKYVTVYLERFYK